MHEIIVSLHGIFESGHVDYKTVFDIAFHNAVPGFIDVLHGGHLNIGHDVMFRAKIEHLLRFLNAANDTSQECLDLSAGDGRKRAALLRQQFHRNGFVLRRHDVWTAQHFRKLFMRVNRADA
jgi:hypothetical protein